MRVLTVSMRVLTVYGCDACPYGFYGFVLTVLRFTVFVLRFLRFLRLFLMLKDWAVPFLTFSAAMARKSNLSCLK